MKSLTLIVSSLGLGCLGAFAAPLQVLLPDAGSPSAKALAAEIAPLLQKNGAVLEAVEGFPTAAQWEKAQVVVLAGTDLKAFGNAPREALEKFAKRGGGIVALGGALGGGDWMKDIAGGAWTEQSRKFSNKLMLYAVTDGHPITKNASPFDLEDETWYDLNREPSIQVLASAFTPKVTSKRIDPRSPEKLDRANVYDLQPQMWTFEAADKHRAFVLLPSRTGSLRHPSIRSFLLRAISWTGRQDSADAFCSPADIATLRYPSGGPRTAADTVKAFEIHPGFKASVVASEPLINKPIAMQWDAKGRLWVAETPEYPNGRRPLVAESWKETGVLKPDNYDRPATDRISILSAPDAGGQFTQKTVFHEGLELITGFCLYGDGVIAVAQPDIVFIHGEGKAQKVDRLYTGFTPRDTHFVANHFIAAPDGWIYANTGSGPAVESVSHPAVKAQLSAGMFRFKPDGSAIEQVSSKGGNGFGAEVTSDGELFFNQATSGNPVQHVVLPEWILRKGTSRDLKTGAASVIEQRKVVRNDMPERGPFMQIDVVGGYSSSCASTVNEGGGWPAEWSNGVFCSEPILDIIHHEKLVPASATFTGEMVRQNAEFLRSQDFWFFPIDIQFGPDGAMYVLDFYNPIVAHSDTRGPQHSAASASVRPDREHYFGRIYRIQHESAKQLAVPDLEKASPAELAAAFKHPNKGVRFTAHRLLMGHSGANAALPGLQAMAAGEPFAPARILALWALERLGQLNADTLQGALASTDASVRKAALLAVESLGAKNTANVAPLLKDAEPRVRLTALRAMASSPLSPDSAKALLLALPGFEDAWSRSAAIAAAASNAGPVLQAALASTEPPSNALLDLAATLSSSLTESESPQTVAKVIAAAANASPAALPLAQAVLDGIAGGAFSKAKPDPAVLPALETLLTSPDAALSAAALPLAKAWGGDRLAPQVAARLSTLLQLPGDASQPAAIRALLVRGLLRAGDASAETAMLALLRSNKDDGLSVEIVRQFALSGNASLGSPLTELLPGLPPLSQNALFDALSGRTEWTNAVLDALEKQTLKVTLLGPARLSKLRMHPDQPTAKRALAVINTLGSGTNPAKNTLIEKLEPEIEAGTGDVAKGKELFTAACATCHRFNGTGVEVGPVLDGIGVHGTHEMLVHIIDPSRVVDNEHRTWNIALKNGSFAVGIIARENDRSLQLKQAGGVAQEIAIADIKTRQEVPQSLMPEGFEGLGADGLRNLFAYLKGGNSKYRALNLGNSFTTDTTGGLYQNRAAKGDTVHPVKFGIVEAEKVPFSLPDPSTTLTGGNVIVLQNRDSGSYASTLPQKVEIPVGFAAGNLHFLSGVAGWGGGPDTKRPAMKVTMLHADGQKQVEELYSGEVFIDYNSGFDVPGSKRVSGITKQHHVRYFSLPVQNRTPIKTLVLESYKNGMSPTTLAITADSEAPKARTVSSPASAAAPGEAKPAPKPAPPKELPKSGETLPAQAASGVLRALLIGGGSSHDYERFFHTADAQTLTSGGKVVAAYTSNAEEAVALMPNADVIVLSANHPSFGTPEFQQPLNLFADSGRGLVVVHAGVWYNWAPVSGYNRRFVGGGSRGHGKGVFTVFNRQSAHPVMAGVAGEFKINDEHYRTILDAGTPVEVLAETEPEAQTQQPYPAVWVVQDPKARIVGISLGHAEEAHSNPAYQTLLKNAVSWVAGR
jgi:putative membrane-bound dehydrogenase-like protein